MKVKVKRKHKAEKGDVTFRIIITNLPDVINGGYIEARTATKVHEAADEMYQQILKYWLTADTIIKDRIRQAFNDMKEVVKDAQKTNTVIENPSINGLAIPSLDFEINRCCDGDDDKEIISIKFSPRIINVDIDSFVDMLEVSAIKVGPKYSVKIEAESIGIDAWEPVDEKVSDIVPELEADQVNPENPEKDSDPEKEDVDSKKSELALVPVPEHNLLENHFHAEYYFSARLYHEDKNAKFDYCLTNALTYLKSSIYNKLTEDPTFACDYNNGYISASFINDGVELTLAPQSKVSVSTLHKMITDTIDMVEKRYSSILLVTSMEVNPKTIPVIYPTHDILTLSSCKAVSRLVTMLYQFRENKGIDDHSRGECFERIKEKIYTAYNYGHNVIMVNDIFIKITNKDDYRYTEGKQIDYMANLIMAVMIATGGNFKDSIYDFKIKDIDTVIKNGKKNGWRF